MRFVIGRGTYRNVFTRCVADRVIAKQTARELKEYLRLDARS